MKPTRFTIELARKNFLLTDKLSESDSETNIDFDERRFSRINSDQFLSII
jgi:hypothetical protein